MTRTAPAPAPVTDATLRRLSNELVRLKRRRGTSSSAMMLDASAYKILWLVVDHGPRTLRALAEDLQLDQSTINRQVHAVIGHGYAERYDDPDSPGLLVRATPAGEAAYRSDSQVRADGLRAIVDTLGEQAVAELVAGLADFNDAIDEAVEDALRRD